YTVFFVFYFLFFCFYFFFIFFFFFFSSRRRHTRSYGDWSSDVCSSDLLEIPNSPLGQMSTFGSSRSYAMASELYAATMSVFYEEIGRASCREKCRCRGWQYD